MSYPPIRVVLYQLFEIKSGTSPDDRMLTCELAAPQKRRAGLCPGTDLFGRGRRDRCSGFGGS
jgi:hypothetical protein